MPIEAEGLPPVRSSGPEREMLLEYLDYFRVVLRRKAEGISDADLHRAVAPSSLTLGGLLRHMTVVEIGWFRQTLLDEPPPEPWASAPWEDVCHIQECIDQYFNGWFFLSKPCVLDVIEKQVNDVVHALARKSA